MEKNQIYFINLNGIPSEQRPAGNENYFYYDLQGELRINNGDRLLEIEKVCVDIHKALIPAIFGDIEAYYKAIRIAPELVITGGLNSESLVSRDNFEKFMMEHGDKEETNKLLYLFDCRKLVASIQECTKETLQIQAELYRSLNLDQFFFPAIEEADGTRFITSPVVTKIHALLGFIFIRLHSLLDYTTKLAFEIEHLKTNFSSYPRLSSSNILFGQRSRISFNLIPNSLYERCDLITEIELYRNLIIHDGLFDDMPKAYKVIANGETIEKYVLLPDRQPDGQLEKFKNRNLFYSREDKINMRLTALVNEFQTRHLKTLELVLANLK